MYSLRLKYWILLRLTKNQASFYVAQNSGPSTLFVPFRPRQVLAGLLLMYF